MIGFLQQLRNRLMSHLEPAAARYMHHQACAFAHRELPAAPLEHQADAGPSGPGPLRFTFRTRPRLGWFHFLCRCR
ncbi:MAG: hypothetical protein IH614_10820 [Desulfuromonadales bacterium]|nr:hypothetical protein [Desulfuromonadales bacterium]